MINEIYEISTFTNIFDAVANHQRLTRKEFITLLSKRSIRVQKDGMLFAPAVFKVSRSNDNFISASCICLDFDHGQPSIENVLELFPDTLTAYYSTHSHKPGNPRFRVVMPLTRTVNADEHVIIVLGIKSIITPSLMECLDATCFERARSHYLPSSPPNQHAHAFSGHKEGSPLDVEHFLTLGRMAVSAAKMQICSDHVEQTAINIERTTSHTFEFTDRVSGEVIDLADWAVKNPTFDIVSAVRPQYLLNIQKDGKQHIRCPYGDQHTDQSQDLAAFIANASPPKYCSWDIHCCHAHCVDRDRLEFFHKMLEKGWFPDEVLQATTPISMKRPPYVNYKAQEIAQELLFRPLHPKEFRILLHIFHIAWTAQDGTLADDDWTISRGLGLPEKEWKKIRETLIRSEWLTAEGGRLYNSIAKREYYKAQDALMSKVAGGRNGGKKAQQNRFNPGILP